MALRNVQFIGSNGAAWPWSRQFPEGKSVWGNTRYAINTSPDFEPDWLVVYEGWPPGELRTKVPRERCIFICAEPESFHRYQRGFLRQFGHIVTTQSRVRHPGLIRCQVAINWFVGVRFFGEDGPHQPILAFDDFLKE